MVKEYELTERGKDYLASARAMNFKGSKLVQLLELVEQKAEREEALENILFPNSAKDKLFPNLVGKALKQGLITFEGLVRYCYPFPAGVEVKTAMALGDFNYADYRQTRHALDFYVPFDTPIFASRRGTVKEYSYDSYRIIRPEQLTGLNLKQISKLAGRFTNYVVIAHCDGTFAEYQNFGKFQVDVRAGQSVMAGDLLGHSGRSGIMNEENPHIHFNVYKKADNGYYSLPVKFQKRIKTKE